MEVAAASLQSDATRLTRTVVLASAVLALLAVTFLFVRRVTGALVEPLPTEFLVAAGALAAAVATLFRIATRSLRSSVVHRLPTAGLILFAAAVSSPATPAVALVALWAIVAGEEIGWWRWTNRLRNSADEAPHPTELPSIDRPERTGIRIDPPQTPAPHFPLEDVSQQFTRIRAADGGDLLCGFLRAWFPLGQRTQTAHIAFCPPFDAPPKLTLRQVAGAPARIKEGSVMPFGARLEFKLNAPAADAVTVLIEFSAQARSVNSAGKTAG